MLHYSLVKVNIFEGFDKVDGYEFIRLLPPPKGSGFPPTTTERILFMKSF